MTPQWLKPVVAALDARSEVLGLVVRADDGGWDDDRLAALIDVCGRSGVAVDVAVIPTAVSPSLVATLEPRLAAGWARIHQHGFAHENHQRTGRKSEFGDERTPAEIQVDLFRGARILSGAFGPRVDPVFTPPWNRCTPDVGPILRDLGVRVLSRDESAGRLDVDGLAEVPVAFDWSSRRGGRERTLEEHGERLAELVTRPQPLLGLMFHHAVTSDAELSAIGELLGVLAGHDRVRPLSILAAAALEPAGR